MAISNLHSNSVGHCPVSNTEVSSSLHSKDETLSAFLSSSTKVRLRGGQTTMRLDRYFGIFGNKVGMASSVSDQRNRGNGSAFPPLFKISALTRKCSSKCKSYKKCFVDNTPSRGILRFQSAHLLAGTEKK